jgi:hypothetical protein
MGEAGPQDDELMSEGEENKAHDTGAEPQQQEMLRCLGKVGDQSHQEAESNSTS